MTQSALQDMKSKTQNIETQCSKSSGLEFSYSSGGFKDDPGVILISSGLAAVQEDYALGTRALDLLGFAVAFPNEIDRYTGCNRSKVEKFTRDFSDFLNELGVDTSRVWEAPVQRKYGALMPESLLKVLEVENPMYEACEE